MGKRGQLELSFNMIFSIIIIVATIAVGAYVISFFLGLGVCNDIGLFYNDLEGRVNGAWESDIAKDVFEGKLPGGVEEICFGNLTLPVASGFEEEHRFLQKYGRRDMNLFLYPSINECDVGFAYHQLDNVLIEEFFCVRVVKGIVKIGINKGKFDALVRISKI